jgi:hypothetical protein
LKKVNRKIQEYKRNGMFEVTLSQILSENQLKFLTKQFKSSDRKIFLSKSFITETGKGINRKWHLTSKSFVDLKEFPRPEDLALSEDEIKRDQRDVPTFESSTLPTEDIGDDHQCPVDKQEKIEERLLELITDLFIQEYPSSPQSRVEVLLNVVEKYVGDSNPEINVDLARESTLPQETILKLMRPIIKDHLEIQRATMGETKMLTKQRINKIAQLKISLTHLEDQEKNEIQTQKNYIEDYTNPRRLLLIGNVTNPCVIAY